MREGLCIREATRLALEQNIRSGNLSSCMDQISQAFGTLRSCYQSRNKILVCGNGGSAAESEHFIAELMKGFKTKRPITSSDKARVANRLPKETQYLADMLQQAIPAISLVSQVSLCTAIANDISYEMVFAQQVYGYGVEGDVLVAISTSGNAANVLNALRVARAAGIKTVGITGGSGGRMRELSDVCICVPSTDNLEIQAYHLWVIHTLCAMLEAELFD